jgi:general secretion pathway protein G
MLAGRKPAQRRRGFTLVEVLLVLIILVVIGSLVYTAIGPMQTNAFRRAAKSQVQAFESVLKAYRLDMNDYPSTSQGLDALRRRPGEISDGAQWNGPYLEKDIPSDPWGNPYQYEYPGKRNGDAPDIWSMGPDKASGTDDDVGNWN